MLKQEKWRALLTPTLKGTPFELVGVECVGGGKNVIIRIFIDKPGGITIDDIVKLSREFSLVLEVEAPIRGSYTLEISSPGLDRHLFIPAHFEQQVGNKIALKTSLPLNHRQNFKGILKRATAQGIELEVDNELFTFTYDEIDKARVVPDIKIPGGK